MRLHRCNVTWAIELLSSLRQPFFFFFLPRFNVDIGDFEQDKNSCVKKTVLGTKVNGATKLLFEEHTWKGVTFARYLEVMFCKVSKV